MSLGFGLGNNLLCFSRGKGIPSSGFNILTEGGDFLDTESGARLQVESAADVFRTLTEGGDFVDTEGGDRVQTEEGS